MSVIGVEVILSLLKVHLINRLVFYPLPFLEDRFGNDDFRDLFYKFKFAILQHDESLVSRVLNLSISEVAFDQVLENDGAY